MSTHVEWVNAADDSVTVYGPGEIEDEHGQVNDKPVVALGDVVVLSGDLDQLMGLSQEIQRTIVRYVQERGRK